MRIRRETKTMTSQEGARHFINYSWKKNGELHGIQAYLPQWIVYEIGKICNAKLDRNGKLSHKGLWELYLEILLNIEQDKYLYSIDEKGCTVLLIKWRSTLCDTTELHKCFHVVFDEISAFIATTNDLFNTKAWDIYNDRIQSKLDQYDRENK